MDVAVTPEEEVWPLGSGGRTVTETLTHGARDTTSGQIYELKAFKAHLKSEAGGD